jgi:uncharacterized membrane protein
MGIEIKYSSVISGLKKMWLFFVILRIIILPFIIWDAFAFFDDVWLYSSGRSQISYPLKTSGNISFGVIVLLTAWVKDAQQYFPF